MNVILIGSNVLSAVFQLHSLTVLFEKIPGLLSAEDGAVFLMVGNEKIVAISLVVILLLKFGPQVAD
jgi:hypothetical protein